VAGSVGVLLSDLWEWFDGTQSARGKAVAFGRGLQAVNILRNRAEDLARGVDFFPSGWCQHDLIAYARENLALAGEYVEDLPVGTAREFCRIPLLLAYSTLAALARGEPKLNRDVVIQLIGHHPCTSICKEKSVSNGSRRNFSLSEMVVVVDETDEPVGVEEKITAHRLGIRHRAFSIFILNSQNELLLQKRARTKYHSPSRWSNTCCGHPRFGESIEEAGRRRLLEEMGFNCDVRKLFAFEYRAELENDLIENEYDHVLIGRFDGKPKPNAREVEGWKWVNLQTIQSDALEHPEEYTSWFLIAIDTLCKKLTTVDK
jgi:isopentenyl-diphosphate Delta-isomerase